MFIDGKWQQAENGEKFDVFNPSITISEGEVLSLEEKFQGGTGINLTPPPEEIMSNDDIELIKELIGILAKRVGISGRVCEP